MSETTDERIAKALDFAGRFGTEDGGHHKMWVIDQMVRALTGCPMVEKLISRFPDVNGNTCTYTGQGESDEYREFLAGHHGDWDEGIAP